MRKTILAAILLTAVSLLMLACGAPAANNSSNAGNKAANTAAAPAADKAAVEGEIKKMMDDFAAALNKADVDSLNKMYSDDYSLIDANGAMHTKATRVDAIKSGRVKMEGIKFNDLKVKTNPAGDGAVVTGNVTGKTTVDGKAEEANSMVTWVLGKMKDKGWQFVNAQITNINADAAKAADKTPASNTAATNSQAAKPPPPPANK